MIGINLNLMWLAARGSGGASWSPVSLFASGEQGVVFDPSDRSTLFQDADGMTPVTGIDQPVRLMMDKSGCDNHILAPADARRPIYRTNGQLSRLEPDGVDDQMISSPLDWASDTATVIIGLTNTKTTGYGAILDFSHGSSLAAGAWSIQTGHINPGRYYASPARGSATNTVNNAAHTGELSAGFYPRTDVLVMNHSIPDSLSRMWLNGVLQTDGLAAKGTGPFGVYPMYLFARNTDVRSPWGGAGSGLRGLIAINRLLNAEEMALAQDWMAAKTGVTI